MSTAIGYISRITKTGKVNIKCSLEDPLTTNRLDAVLEYLLEDYNEPRINRVKVCWNVTEFIEPILTLLTKEQRDQLLNNNMVDLLVPERNGITFKKFHVRYWPYKALRIYYLKYETAIFSLFRYYDTWDEWDEHIPEDEFEVKNLGDYLLERLNDMQIFKGKKITNLSSPISIYETTIMRHMDIPTHTKVPREAKEAVIDYAWYCVAKPWISAFKLGYWDEGECFDYDIISAYGSEVAKLYHTGAATYQKSDSFVKGAHWGYLKGKAKIDAPISPIILDDGSCLVGEKEVETTLDVVRCIYKYQLGSFDLHDGWFLTFKHGQRPFKIPMERLFNERNSKGLRKAIAKQLGASFWGKFAEYHPGDSNPFGKYANLFYAAQITNGINIELVKFILDNNLLDALIHIRTDGVLLDTQALIDKVKGIGKLGQWRLDNTGPALVAGPHKQWLGKYRDFDKVMGFLKDNPKRRTSEHLDFVTMAEDQNRVFKKLPADAKDLFAKKYTSAPKILTIHA